MLKKPELLAPAGSFEKAKIAFLYGADAVYAGTAQLSLRTRAEMKNEDLYEVIRYAHKYEKKVYSTINIYARDNDYYEIAKQARELDKLGVDGIIVADGGVLEIVKENAPNTDIHISTQANVVSSNSAKFWYNNGAKRIITGRELTKNEINEIMKNKPENLEVEMFIHGAICFSYSGRCVLSDFLANRSANLGDCAQSCRWEYNAYLEENKKPGLLMPIVEDEKGTYILSSRDLCLIKKIPEIIEMGVSSLKIEGRLKTDYYLATVVNTYRQAIDDYFQDKENWNYEKYLIELEKIKTRGITEFYFEGRENNEIQDLQGLQQNPDYEYGAKVRGKDGEYYILEIRNRLCIGDEMEIILPNKIQPYKWNIDKIYDFENDNEIAFINPGKFEQKIKVKIPIELQEGIIIRRKKL